MIGPLWTWDAVDVASGIRTGLISSCGAVQASLDRLAAVNPAINAVTVVHAEQALLQADEADRAVLRGDALGLLHGVPVTTKENVDQAGSATSHGVVAFKDDVASADSPVVANLRKAGAKSSPLTPMLSPNSGGAWRGGKSMRYPVRRFASSVMRACNGRSRCTWHPPPRSIYRVT